MLSYEGNGLMGFRLVVRTQMEEQKGACRETPGGAAAPSLWSRGRDCCVCLVTMVTTASLCFWTMKNKRFLIYLFDLKEGKNLSDNSRPERSGRTTSPWRVCLLPSTLARCLLALLRPLLLSVVLLCSAAFLTAAVSKAPYQRGTSEAFRGLA